MSAGINKAEKISIISLMAVTFTLNFLFVHKEGYSNPYYAAAVKSMVQNLHNFFFVSFDTGGFVSVDKPPLGLWIQSISALLFGFHGWSLILPQAIAGALSVGLLYTIVKMDFGTTAAFISALVFMFTPIFIAVNRTNNLDGLLLLIMLLSSLALLISVRRKFFKWFILSLILLGIGFNVKMLQSYMVLPAVISTYLLFVPSERKKKFLHIAAGLAILLISSLWWAVLVDLTPQDKRPYVGGSRTNSVIELTLFYNGITRILPTPGQMGGHASQAPPGVVPPQIETGTPGIVRLLNTPLAGQSSWFLIIGLISPVYIYVTGSKERDNKSIQLFYWSICFISMALYFSISSFFHRYYLVMMAPVIASLTGIGLSYILNDIKNKVLGLYNFPFLLLLIAFAQFIIILRYPPWALFIIPIMVILLIISVSLLIASHKKENTNLLHYAFTMGIMALLIGPAYWTLTPIIYQGDPRLPHAGPELSGNNPNNPLNQFEPPDNIKLIQFLKTNKGSENFLIAVPDANIASAIILSSDEEVLAYGGFNGIDKVFSPEEFISLIKTGQVRFVMVLDMDDNKQVKGSPGPPFPGNAQTDITKWVLANGKEIPRNEWINETSDNSPHEMPLKIFDLKEI